MRNKVNTWLFVMLLIIVVTGCNKMTSTGMYAKELNIAADKKMGEVDKTSEVDSAEKEEDVSDNTTILEQSEASQHVETDVTKEAGSEQTIEKEETHTHKWVAQTKTIQQKEQGHYETKVVQEAYDEDVYAWRTFCNKCGEDISDLKADEIAFHSAVLCESGYHADYVVVETIHHDAVTEQVWIVDKPASTETVTTGYKCSCGAMQKK